MCVSAFADDSFWTKWTFTKVICLLKWGLSILPTNNVAGDGLKNLALLDFSSILSDVVYRRLWHLIAIDDVGTSLMTFERWMEDDA